ncbi:hypothetical protein NE857_03950 [Nocardiopsis exhalans]|uniref:Uncharacterized protein n=1 Tax=Nocardiopsis exhalans TaxID=163604 RepID=A0ABY5DCG0_9ACTN|nr:hypothetical protein [Nocardiopsis exhalans]USY20817.1 hypothetical protein NE857_03950 [Nocardiopsis exhalans]
MGSGEAIEFGVAGGKEEHGAVYINADHGFHDFRDCRSGLVDTVEGRFPSAPGGNEKGPYGDWELIGTLDTPEPGNHFARRGVSSDEPAGSGVGFARAPPDS